MASFTSQGRWDDAPICLRRYKNRLGSQGGGPNHGSCFSFQTHGGENVTPASCNKASRRGVGLRPFESMDDLASCLLTWDDFCAVSAKGTAAEP